MHIIILPDAIIVKSMMQFVVVLHLSFQYFSNMIILIMNIIVVPPPALGAQRAVLDALDLNNKDLSQRLKLIWGPSTKYEGNRL